MIQYHTVLDDTVQLKWVEWNQIEYHCQLTKYDTRWYDTIQYIIIILRQGAACCPESSNGV